MSYYSVTKFSIFLSPLNVMDWFTLKQRWDLLDQQETQWWISSFRLKLVFTLMGALISKIIVLGAQKTHMWPYVMHLLRMTVWCGLWNVHISLKCWNTESITVNGDTYRSVINDFFVFALHGVDMNEFWFQEVCAICNTFHVTIDWLCNLPHISCHNWFIIFSAEHH